MKTEMHPEKKKWKGSLSEMETQLRLQTNHYSKINSKEPRNNTQYFLCCMICVDFLKY